MEWYEALGSLGSDAAKGAAAVMVSENQRKAAEINGQTAASAAASLAGNTTARYRIAAIGAVTLIVAVLLIRKMRK